MERRREARAAAEVEAITVAGLRARIGDLRGYARSSTLAARVVAGALDPYRRRPAVDTLVDDASHLSPAVRRRRCRWWRW